MKNCKTCKWWSRAYGVNGEGQSDCGLIGLWKHVSAGKVVHVEVKVSDDSGLDVVLMTSGEFGCVLHEEA